jgi:hypothetical protein
MAILKLAIDRQNKTLVEVSGSFTELPPLYQTNTQQFQIQVVDPTGDPGAPYEVVDCSASELRVVLAAAVTGTEGDEAANLLAATYEAGWGWDAGLDAFTGSLNLHTAELIEFIGNNAFAAAIFEVNLITGGVSETLFGHRSGAANCTISANADIGGADAPEIIEQAQVVGTKILQDGVGNVTIVDNLVTIAGLALAGVPAHVFIFINAPSGSGFIGGCFVIGSATANQFEVILSAIPDVNTYSLTYILTF